ncbi:hypothetical protein BZG36_00356 [Bifiguratus adelaidae]|uniref:Bud neck involved protein n=1 Tax=Bifiguratus adelaidae TaxID=1938954 RepID=A0A261Y7R1_9FUNG|nr:hypothetical protein BZG36_00356 [Bifiguratus adelaidae]
MAVSVAYCAADPISTSPKLSSIVDEEDSRSLPSFVTPYWRERVSTPPDDQKDTSSDQSLSPTNITVMPSNGEAILAKPTYATKVKENLSQARDAVPYSPAAQALRASVSAPTSRLSAANLSKLDAIQQAQLASQQHHEKASSITRSSPTSSAAKLSRDVAGLSIAHITPPPSARQSPPGSVQRTDSPDRQPRSLVSYPALHTSTTSSPTTVTSSTHLVPSTPTSNTSPTVQKRPGAPSLIQNLSRSPTASAAEPRLNKSALSYRSEEMQGISDADFVHPAPERRPSITSINSSTSVKSTFSVRAKQAFGKRLRKVFSMDNIRNKSKDSDFNSITITSSPLSRSDDTASIRGREIDTPFGIARPSSALSMRSVTTASTLSIDTPSKLSMTPYNKISSPGGPQPTTSQSTPRSRFAASFASILSGKSSSTKSMEKPPVEMSAPGFPSLNEVPPPSRSIPLTKRSQAIGRRHSTSDLAHLSRKDGDINEVMIGDDYFTREEQKDVRHNNLRHASSSSTSSVSVAANGRPNDKKEVIRGILKLPAPSPGIPGSEGPIPGPTLSTRSTKLPQKSSLRSQSHDLSAEPSLAIASATSALSRHQRSGSYTSLKSSQQSIASANSAGSTSSRSLRFSPSIIVHDTFASAEYDRRCDANVTSAKLTPMIAMRIKQELNEYKLKEMEVHAESRVYTHFFL